MNSTYDWERELQSNCQELMPYQSGGHLTWVVPTTLSSLLPRSPEYIDFSRAPNWKEVRGHSPHILLSLILVYQLLGPNTTSAGQCRDPGVRRQGRSVSLREKRNIRCFHHSHSGHKHLKMGRYHTKMCIYNLIFFKVWQH